MAINKRKVLDSAQKHLQRGALDRALKDYQSLLGADPRDTNVRLRIGDLQLRLGHAAEAVDAYLKVAAQFMKDGFDAKAVAIFKQVHRIDARRAEVWEPLAELYQRMGLNAEAMAALQTAADARRQAGRRGEALDLLRRMASLDPTNTTSRLKVAELLRADGRHAEAVVEYRAAALELERQAEGEGAAAALEKAIELQGEDSDLLEQAVRVLLQHGSAARAEALARRLIEIDAETPSGYEQLAAVLQALGREDALPEVYRRLAEVYRKRGDEDEARSILQRFVPVEPLSSEVPPGSAARDAAGLLPGSEAPDFGGGHELEIDPLAGEEDPGFRGPPSIGDPMPQEGEAGAGPVTAPDAEAAFDLGQLLSQARVYLEYGKHDRAIESLRAVLASEPEHATALERLGEACTAAGRSQEAVHAFVRAAELARAAADLERFEVLRGRVESLDPYAAAALGPLAPAAGAAEQGGVLEEEIEFSIDDEFGAVEEDAGASAAAEPTWPETPARHESAPEGPEGVGEASEPGAPPQQILEDLDEADFYRQQGMLEEAEAVYRRVLERSPGHPEARMRLGELPAPRAGAQPALAQREEPPFDPGAGFLPEDFSLDEEPGEPAASRAGAGAEPPVAEGLVDELAADSFGLGDETPDPFGFAEEAGASEPEPTPPPAQRATASEPSFELGPEPRQAAVTLSGREPDPPVPLEEGVGEDEAAEGFDLAAALSEGLEATNAGGEVSTEEEGFAALLHEFKRGVQETLGEGDVECRYDLGIAYREMGLFEDAYDEFRAALRSPVRRYDATHMLAQSALDLGRAAEVLPQLRTALDEGAPEEQQPALRFDLGCLHRALGQTAEALESFRFVAAIAPGFCEVEQQIEQLTGSPSGAPGASQAAPSAQPRQQEPEAPRCESFESFDDVTCLAEEVDTAEPVADERPESQPLAEAPAEPEVAPETGRARGAVPGPARPEAPQRDGEEAVERPRNRRRKITFF